MSFDEYLLEYDLEDEYDLADDLRKMEIEQDYVIDKQAHLDFEDDCEFDREFYESI